MKNIVLLGGGSGISHLLKAFQKEKNYRVQAIVATSDSGGSTGILRDEYHIPAIGDLVKNLAALGGDKTKWVTKRYQEGSLS
ncbi:YvcK family protein [Candidatus Peribacteria bacterium]|nr:YvcK family protein [Candidatus Peribacteria bacterium]